MGDARLPALGTRASVLPPSKHHETDICLCERSSVWLWRRRGRPTHHRSHTVSWRWADAEGRCCAPGRDGHAVRDAEQGQSGTDCALACVGRAFRRRRHGPWPALSGIRTAVVSVFPGVASEFQDGAACRSGMAAGHCGAVAVATDPLEGRSACGSRPASRGWPDSIRGPHRRQRIRRLSVWPLALLSWLG
jgi:hypothetical protein